MKTFRFYCNETKKTKDLAKRLRNLLLKTSKFTEVSTGAADFCIALGGDGCFLRMVRECNFCGNTKFVGVNTGTLGFLQGIKTSEMESFVACLARNVFIEQRLSYLECEFEFKGGRKKVHCLNDIVIRDADLKIIHLKVKVDGTVLENFVGDGLLVATSVGSTAYNLSLGGSFVPIEFDTLQLTPVAPLNSAVYRNLTNSVIMPETACIEILPEAKDINLIASADGVNFCIQGLKKIKIRLANNRLRYVKLDGYSFWEKINEKFLQR